MSCSITSVFTFKIESTFDEWAAIFDSEEAENEGISKILSRSTEKQLAFANDAMDMRSTGKGSDPDAMIYDLSSTQLEHSLDKIEMIYKILSDLKDKYTQENDTPYLFQ